MKKSELKYDKTKHILYSDKIEGIIKEHLAMHYDEDEASRLWEKIQLKYVEFLEDLPYLGGKKCRHNGPGGTYDCIAIFAYYEVQETKPSLDELYEMNNSAFMPAFERLGKIVDANKPIFMKILNMAFKMTAKADKKLETTCPTGYVMRVEPLDMEQGVRYKFLRCPIAEFAKAHGYTHLMPAFCNGDYPAINLLGAKLIREHTCSNGNYCDYQIVGSDSPLAKECPMEIDSAGYMRNCKVAYDDDIR